MKPIKFLPILCILLSFSVPVINAQEEEEGTYSFFMPVEVEFELWCGDVFIDFIDGVYAEAHFRVHYCDGSMIWMKFTTHGTFQFKGVTYEVSGKSNKLDEDIQEGHYNVKGDDGSHYVGIFTTSDWLHEFTFSKALCVGN